MLRYEAKFVSALAPAQSRSATLTWLQSIGYRVTSPPFLSSVVLQRGSVGGNFASLNPKHWRSTVRGSWRPVEGGSEITLEWSVTILGQVYTRADVAFWTYEIEKTLTVAFGGAGDPFEFQRMASRTQMGDTWRAVVFTVALLGPLGLGWATTGNAWVGIVLTAVIGTGCYITFRAPRTLGDVPVPTEPTRSSMTPPPARS